MRAVITRVDEHFLADRRKRGADRWDEMWEGELHMVPAPNSEHQRMLLELASYLNDYCKRTGQGWIYFDINIAPPGGWPGDFRIPDLSFIATGREGGFVDGGACFEGAPDTVFEIRSPGQESNEKLPFFASLGVPEAIVIGRDDKSVVVHVLAGDRYEVQRPDEHGWNLLTRLGVEIRTAPECAGGKPSIELRVQGSVEVQRI